MQIVAKTYGPASVPDVAMRGWWVYSTPQADLVAFS